MNSVTAKKVAPSQTFYLICAALVLATVGVYSNVGQFDFVNYDDPNNIYQNPVVLSGLHPASFIWGLTTSYFEYWHPVTWWSHILDTEFFGATAGGRHWVNLGFHLANTLLVLLWLQRLTGALWRSALVAALFGLHPMQVESVAWLSERKDVLAAFFGLLTLLAYTRFVQRSPSALLESPSAIARHFQSRSYCWALGFFALGLMAKPTVVTWPFVLLLLDVWPLNRLNRVTLKPLLREKIPFFALSVLSSLISYFSLKGEVGKVLDAKELTLAFRLTNVPVSYARYLWKLIWPEDLAVLYPLPPGLWPWWQIVGSVLLLVVISIAVWRLFPRQPVLLIGWLIFLGVLVPASGIVGVGLHAMADRFTYLPSIGLFIAVVWGGAELLRLRSIPVLPIAIGVGAMLLALSVTCWRQVQHWQNSEQLWTHCLAVTPDNAVAHYNLGHVLQHSGRSEEAVPHYQETTRLMPEHVDAPLNLGAIRFAARDYVAATNYFQRALVLRPNYTKAHLNLGMALNELKDFSDASNHLAQAVAADPDNLQIHCVYAWSLVELGNAPAAMEQTSAALKLDPNNGIAFALLARAHSLRGERAEAREYFAQAVRLAPDYGDGHYWAGLEAMQAGDFEGAVGALENAARLKPDSAEVKFYLAVAYGKRGRAAEAIEQNRAALQLSPNWSGALNNLAWLLATTPTAALRDGKEAVTLAQRACELTEFKQAQLIGTLAAALAEAGQFDEAVATAERAARLARETGQTQLAETNEKLRTLFQNRNAFRE